MKLAKKIFNIFQQFISKNGDILFFRMENKLLVIHSHIKLFRIQLREQAHKLKHICIITLFKKDIKITFHTSYTFFIHFESKCTNSTNRRRGCQMWWSVWKMSPQNLHVLQSGHYCRMRHIHVRAHLNRRRRLVINRDLRDALAAFCKQT